MANRTHAEEFRALAAVLAAMPALHARLLADHKPGWGGHCLACTMRGSQKQTPWPCGIHALAQLAHTIRYGQR